MMLFDTHNLAEYINLILKSIGVAFVASICSNICLELGKPTIADIVLLVGKLELLLLCLPLAVKIISYVTELI